LSQAGPSLRADPREDFAAGGRRRAAISWFCRIEPCKVSYRLDLEPNERGLHMVHSRIAVDPAVMLGKPCIKGTRITVELILRKLGAGRSFADILDAYPQLNEEDLRAALAFAADFLEAETVLAVE
jgi:uncharacterized protein (DUF433 family)